MELHDLFNSFGDVDSLPPERRILVAAVNCIEEFGMKGATVRRIAAKAGLNPAAINYYYRSKDKLIEEALRGAWTHVAADIDLVMRETTDPTEVFGITASYLLEGAFRNPKLVRAIMAEHPTLHIEVADFFKSLFGRMTEKGGSRESLRHGFLLLTAFAVFLGFTPNVVEVLSGIDLSDKERRQSLWIELSKYLFDNAVKLPGQ
jgi:AcrR family transcriptional regulator